MRECMNPPADETVAETAERRSGAAIMGKLVGLVTPLLPFMFLAVAAGTAGYLCAIFLTVTAAAGVLTALGLSVPRMFSAGVSALCVTMAGMALLRGVLHYIEQDCNHYIAFKLLAIIRHKVFAALRRLCPAKLEGKDRGNLISMLTSDIELLEVFYAHTISPIAIAVLTCAIMTAFIGSLSLPCGVLALCGYAAVGIALPLWNARRGAAAGVSYREAFGEMNSFVLDSLRGIRETIQYGQTERRLQALADGSDRLAEKQKRLKLLEGDSAAATGFVITLFSFAMLLGTMYLYSAGSMTFSGALLASIAMMSSFGPVTALSNLSNNLNQTLACGERVLSLLEETPQTEETEEMPETGFSGAALADVCFSYGEEPILSNVSMRIEKGKILGIHGRSGSGKSTILKLLMRFWDTDSGTVQISGKDIRRVNTTDLRRMEGYVTQETVLFQDTIAGNIGIGKPGAPKAEIEAAARKASLDAFVKTLPMGYDTPVAELGDSLSGGERQRIGIARAFLHESPFLLLDEPTSNLDSLNEGMILKALNEERKDRTVVLVSHRDSTMAIADEVYEMGNARVS